MEKTIDLNFIRLQKSKQDREHQNLLDDLCEALIALQVDRDALLVENTALKTRLEKLNNPGEK